MVRFIWLLRGLLLFILVSILRFVFNVLSGADLILSIFMVFGSWLYFVLTSDFDLILFFFLFLLEFRTAAAVLVFIASAGYHPNIFSH